MAQTVDSTEHDLPQSICPLQLAWEAEVGLEPDGAKPRLPISGRAGKFRKGLGVLMFRPS